MRFLGLTGGIASGKSTVAQMLRDQGAAVVDADLIARQVVEPGTPGLAAVAARWPDLVRGGALDRKGLSERIFGDPEERKALNAILHPLIAAESQRQVQALVEAGAPVVVYEAALIVENGLDKGMDGLIVVKVSPEVQRARLQVREGLSEDAARKRLASQASLEEKLAHATWVIDNSGSLDDTRRHVQQLWQSVGNLR
jgi:dephospho-CoA kinase